MLLPYRILDFKTLFCNNFYLTHKKVAICIKRPNGLFIQKCYVSHNCESQSKEVFVKYTIAIGKFFGLWNFILIVIYSLQFENFTFVLANIYLEHCAIVLKECMINSKIGNNQLLLNIQSYIFVLQIGECIIDVLQSLFKASCSLCMKLLKLPIWQKHKCTEEVNYCSFSVCKIHNCIKNNVTI